MASDLRAKGWESARRHSNAGRELTGRLIGIVGIGNVGRALTRIAQRGFGMQVLAHARTPGNLPHGVEATRLSDLPVRADIVALRCPLTDETTGLIEAAAVAQMKPDAFLVNVARGPVLGEAGLLAALQSGKPAGACWMYSPASLCPPITLSRRSRTSF